jgi:predicted O-methyltransferase YrrM
MTGRLPPEARRVADGVPGFLPGAEAEALYDAAMSAPDGPLLEIGTYCGKSAVWLGCAARRKGTVLFTVDHHRGSEEHQPGWDYHDPTLVDPQVGRIDTLPTFRRAMATADLESAVVAVVGRSATVAAHWTTPLSFVFIDGGHTDAAARADYACWAPRLVTNGLLAIHDVFEDPAAGGQAPYRIWRRAVESGAFTEVATSGSLRVLRRLREHVEAGLQQ